MKLTVQPVAAGLPTVTIAGSTYTLSAELGSGGQACVVLGKAATGALIAVKVFYAHAVNAAPRELQFLEALQSHDNVVKYLGTAQITGRLPINTTNALSASGIAMEYAEGGDFIGYLLGLDINREPLEPAGARLYFRQMLDGLMHVHACGIVVCDLKLDNMLLLDESCRQLQLADFGHAARRDHLPVEPSGTLAYEAPEVKMRLVTPDNADKIDVWSLGVCLCILVTGFNPFKPIGRAAALNALQQAQALGLNGARAACAVYNHQVMVDRFDLLPDDLRALLNGMLQYDAARRLTLDEVAARSASSGPWTAPEVVEALMAEVVPAASRSRTQLQPPSPDRTRTYHEPADPQTAPAAGPTASYRSMAAADDEAEVPMNRSLGAPLGALGAESPRYNACSALGASYRSAADMELPPPVLEMPMLERENARPRPVA